MTPTSHSLITVADVRPARPDDCAEMADILNEIIQIGGTTAFEDPVTAKNMADWYLDSKSAHCCHVALDDHGRVAGYQALEFSTAYGDGIGEISSFARQTPVVRGVGTALFQATTQAAKAAGLIAINAKIRADNVSGLAYYTKMGFLDHAILKAVPLKDGTPVDRVLKRYALT